MARKLGVFGPRDEVAAAMQAADYEDSSPGADTELPVQTLSIGSTDWTPEQAELYIDWRLQNLDAQIAALRNQLDELTARRKRWLAVTGGRSKVNGNGGSNGSA